MLFNDELLHVESRAARLWPLRSLNCAQPKEDVRDIAIYSHSMNENEEDGRERGEKKKARRRRLLLQVREQEGEVVLEEESKVAARPPGSRRLKSLPLTRGHRTGWQK